MSLLFPAPLPVASVRRSFWRALTVSLVVMAGAIGLLRLLHVSLPVQHPFEILLAAVAFSAWYGGSRVAWVAAVAGAIGVIVLFPHFYQGTRPNASEWIALAFYFMGVTAVTLFASSFRREIHNLSGHLGQAQTRADRAQMNEQNQRMVARRVEEEKTRLSSELEAIKSHLMISEERMRVAQESARYCLFDWSHEDDSISVFGDPLPLFGVSSAKWKTQGSFLECVHPEDRERIHHLKHELAQNHPLDLEVRTVSKDKSERWIAIKGKTRYAPNHVPVRTIGIFLDVTQKKVTEQLLVHTEKLAAAGRLAAAIAHEVNNPLAAATNLLFIIRGDHTLSRSGRQYVHMAEQELARLGRIAKRTLGFYKENSAPVRVDLTSLLDDVLEMYSRNMPAGILVKKDYQPGAHAVVIEGEIRQVFSNVFMNSLQALGEKGTVRLQVGPQLNPRAPGMAITLTDDGPGISQPDLGLIFEPFFTTKREAGTGLGLWIAKQIVERHDGSIQVESSVDAESHGTIVRIFLPLDFSQHCKSEEQVDVA